MASPSWDSSWSQSSPVAVFSSATCCFRVCKSHPTKIMSQPSVGVTSWYSPRPRLPAASGCSHDISDGPPQVSPDVDCGGPSRRQVGERTLSSALHHDRAQTPELLEQRADMPGRDGGAGTGGACVACDEIAHA